jgi:hypothetical protein
MLNKTALVILLAAIVCFVAGCLGDTEQMLLGTWQEIGGQQSTIEFITGGKLTYRPGLGPLGTVQNLKVDGKWAVLSDGRVQIDFTIFGITQSKVGKVSFSNNEMSFTESNGKATRYRKL